MDLHELNFANNQRSFTIIEDLIRRKESIELCEIVDPRDQQTNKISQKLRKIARIEEFIFQERGAKDLYIGWPFVRGQYSDGTNVRCPLIFFPVSLRKKNGSWHIKQRKGVNITFNKTFLLGYSFYNKVSLDEELIEQVLTDLSRDSIAYRTELYEILEKSNLNLHFNQDNFLDNLQSFENYKKADFEAYEKPGELKLFPEAVLGIFPQAGSYLVPDYVKLLDETEDADLESFFMARHKEDPEEESGVKVSDQAKEESTFTPFQMDASQEMALKLVKNGNSMVIQGPPGTGKSQLICNLISDYIARGKNVLLVCQKKAALDVVWERLKQQQLHDFVGLVHDFKNDRKDIFEQISSQIESLDEYRVKNNSLDAIYLERSFLQTSRKIDQITEELDEFKSALFDENECGKSVKELYLSSSPEQPSIPLNQQYRSFHYRDVDTFISKFSRYLDYYHEFEKKPHFWLLGPSFSKYTSQDYIKLKDIITDIPEFDTKLKNESIKFCTQSLDVETGLTLNTHIDEIAQLKTNIDNEQVYEGYVHMLQHEPDEDLTWLTNLERSALNCFKNDGIEYTLNSAELGRFQEALEHAIKARKNPFSWISWQLFSKDKLFVTRVLVANELKSDKQGFESLLKKIDNRLNYEHIVSIIAQKKWLKNLPKSSRKIEIQNWFFYQKLALKSFYLNQKIRTLNQYVPASSKGRKTYFSKLEALIDFLEKIPLQEKVWEQYISQKQIRSILLGKENIDNVINQLTRDFDSLVEYHKLKEAFNSNELKVIEELLEHEHEDKDAAIELFYNSLALAWIDHIETKYPILRAVSSFKIDHLTKDLQEAINDKINLSQEILLLKCRERTYSDIEYNRLNNMVTYKDLLHQVTKKRQIWPIRRVLSQFDEEVFSLLPCWLASPESASAIFPMEEMFDLVIFDEASQCFAERGIPAMYRGKQVVIVGDDKQLQPNDLYRVRWEEESSDIPEMEIDSLLDLSKHYLREVSLRGHYRSKSLELIEFSNSHFYNNKLKLLPDFETMQNPEPSIRYVQVNGTWENNSNQDEAEKIIDLIESINQTNPEKTIGVVTFNVHQQNLILDLLEDMQDAKNKQFSGSIFIKNIENVQGDERDIIIFSTAYAPDAQGKLQLRFGALNQSGGENRLNVAITRAKEKVLIVTSLLPHQLNVEHTANQGPKLLKAYLEYALRVSNKDWQPDTLEDETRNQTWYLRSRLSGELGGAEVKKSLPFSDLTVMIEEKPNGLILTDDDLYYETLSAKEAHCYRQTHFIDKNWKFNQFHSREYWMSGSNTQEKLKKFVNRFLP